MPQRWKKQRDINRNGNETEISNTLQPHVDLWHLPRMPGLRVLTGSLETCHLLQLPLDMEDMYTGGMGKDLGPEWAVKSWGSYDN